MNKYKISEGLFILSTIIIMAVVILFDLNLISVVLVCAFVLLSISRSMLLIPERKKIQAQIKVGKEIK